MALARDARALKMSGASEIWHTMKPFAESSERNSGAHMGIRDFEPVDARARAAGLALEEDNAVPANNRLLVWRRTDAAARTGAGEEQS